MILLALAIISVSAIAGLWLLGRFLDGWGPLSRPGVGDPYWDTHESPGFYLTDGVELERTEGKSWPVDLGEFLKDAEDDFHTQTRRRATGEFDLEASRSSENTP